MLTMILGLLSSGGFGSLVGLAGGILNRKLDISTKKVEYEFELAKMDKQKEYLELEHKTRTSVAAIEADGATEVAGFNALAESYSFAKTTKEDGLVDRFSKTIRPLLTLAFFFLTCYIFYQIHLLVISIPNAISPEELIGIYKMCIEWIFFQAGVAIGWWFAMRPGKTPVFKG